MAMLVGCASAPGADPRDPWEPYNRSVTRFNDAVDVAVL
jgi:phospholipid-binding lipoprotein MlaA